MKLWLVGLSCLLASSPLIGCDKRAPTPAPADAATSPANPADTTAATNAADDTIAALAATPDTAVAIAIKPDVTAPIAVAKRDKLPAPGPSPQWEPPKVNTWKMANGLAVWHVKQSQAPLLSVTVVLPSGGATDPAGKWGLTGLTVDMLDEGAGDRDALHLADAFTAMATDYGASASTDGINFEMHLLADKLDSSLRLLADVLQRPTFPIEEFKRRKAQRIAEAIAAEAQPGQSAVTVMRRALFGQGYGAYSPAGVRNSIGSLSLEDVKAHYKATIQPSGGLVVIVGDIDQAGAQRALETHLAGWTGTPTAKAAALSQTPVKAAIHIVDYADAPQTVLYVARRAPGAQDPGAYDAQVFNRSLGGAFTSRLNMNLREDKGYTYGARSQFLRYRHAGVYMHGGNVKSDTTGPSLVEIRKEITDIGKTRPLTKQEHTEAVSGMLLGFPGRFQSMGNVAGELAGLWPKGFAPERISQWPSKIAEVTLAKAQAMASQYANFDDYIIVAAGDKKLITESLKALKLPVIIHNTQGDLVTD